MRVAFLPWSGALPDDPDELMKIISEPTTVGQAIAAVRKFGTVQGQDVVDNMTDWPSGEFGPLVQSMAVTGKPDIMGHFAAYAVPVRRALAKRYEPVTPEVCLLLDMLVLAYFRYVHVERLTSVCLAMALETTNAVDRALSLQKMADQALAQIHRALDTLNALTGISAQTNPEDAVAALLRFPDLRKAHHQRKRTASAG